MSFYPLIDDALSRQKREGEKNVTQITIYGFMDVKEEKINTAYLFIQNIQYVYSKLFQCISHVDGVSE